MPKHTFFAATVLVFGLIWLAANLGLLPMFLLNFWPLMMILVGLGGLVLGDKSSWDAPKTAKKSTQSTKKVSKSKKKK